MQFIRRHLEFILLVLLAIAITYWNFDIVGPMIQADESGHLMNAAAIAGYFNDFAGSYHAGYSLLISPAFLLGGNPEAVWKWVIVINGLLYFLGVYFLWRFGTAISTQSSKATILLAVIAISLYPMWVIMVGYSFSQIAFFSFFVMATYAFYTAITTQKTIWFILSGVIIGYLYWIHPTGLAVSIAVFMATLFYAIYSRRLKDFIFLTTPVLVMVFSYKLIFVPWLFERMTISGHPPSFHYPSTIELFLSLLTANGVAQFATRFSGHIFYLTAGTLGLIWAYFFAIIFEKHTKVKIPAAISLFLGLSFLGVMTLSVLFFTSSTGVGRLDHWMYGRYVEGVIAPLLLLGALSLSVRSQTFAVLLTVVFGVILILGMGEYTHTARMNVSTFWQDFYLKESGKIYWILSASGILSLTIITLMISVRLTLIFVMIVFLWMSWLQIDWHSRASLNASLRSDISTIIRDRYEFNTCVSFDSDGADSYSRQVYWFDLGFKLYDVPLKRATLEQWRKECNELIFSYKDRSKDGLHLIGSTNSGAGPSLWGSTPLFFPAEYPYLIENKNENWMRILSSGWSELEEKHVWSSEEATLNLPIPEHCSAYECDVEIHFSVYGASKPRPVDVFFNYIDVNEGSKTIVHRATDRGVSFVSIPLSGSNVMLLNIEVPSAVSPNALEGSHDNRVLGIALKQLSLANISGKGNIDFLEGEISNDYPYTQVGRVHSSHAISNGDTGFLLFGPYRPMGAGTYNFSISGTSSSEGAWVDIVSNKATVVHARFSLPESASGRLVSEQVVLEQDVSDLEVRVFVTEQDDVSIEGYTLSRSD